MANVNTFTLSIGPLCPGGNHSVVTVRVNGGQRTFSFPMSKDEALNPPTNIDPEDVVRVLMRNFIVEGGYSTLGAMKTAIEAHTFKI